MTRQDSTSGRTASAQLLTLSSQLWDELSHAQAASANATVQQLWTEHLRIRTILDKMDTINPPKPMFDKRSCRMSAVPAFLDWAKARGVEQLAVEVYVDDVLGGDQLGLRSTRAVDGDEVLARVPRRAMFTWDDATEVPYLAEAMCEDPLLGRMENVALAMYLLCEQRRGADSDYFAYIRTLPETYNTPLYYTKEELALMRCSPALEMTLKMYRSIARQFAYFHVLLATAHSTKDKDPTTTARRLGNTPLNVFNFTFAAYRWAVSTVSTRINHIPSRIVCRDGQQVQTPALIPLLDLANHSDSLAPHVSVFFEPQVDCACVSAPVAIQEAGRPVHIYYGRRSDTEHLLHNGFVCATSANASYALRLGVSHSDVHFAQRVTILESHSLQPTEVFDLATDLTTISQRMLTYARIFVYDFGARDAANPVASVNPVALNSHENTIKAVQYLCARLLLIAQSYDSTLARIAQMATRNEAVSMMQTLLSKEASVVKYTQSLCEKLAMNVSVVCAAEQEVTAMIAAAKMQLEKQQQQTDGVESLTITADTGVPTTHECGHTDSEHTCTVAGENGAQQGHGRKGKQKKKK